MQDFKAAVWWRVRAIFTLRVSRCNSVVFSGVVTYDTGPMLSNMSLCARFGYWKELMCSREIATEKDILKEFLGVLAVCNRTAVY